MWFLLQVIDYLELCCYIPMLHFFLLLSNLILLWLEKKSFKLFRKFKFTEPCFMTRCHLSWRMFCIHLKRMYSPVVGVFCECQLCQYAWWYVQVFYIFTDFLSTYSICYLRWVIEIFKYNHCIIYFPFQW